MITTQAQLVKKYSSPSEIVSYIIFQVEKHFEFLEGQFVMIEADLQWKTVKKPYSIATTNKMMIDEKHLWVVVKKTSDRWMSDFLTQHLHPWDTVTVKWPVWHYVDPKQNRNYLFVSAWSWLSPNVWLFHNLVYETRRYDRIVNVFWERYFSHIVPEIESLFTDHGQENVYNLFFLSQESTIPQWYMKWHVQDWISWAIELLGNDITAFICGKPEMVTDVQQNLIAQWVPKDQIVFEKY